MINKDGSYMIRIIPEPYRIETVEFERMRFDTVRYDLTKLQLLEIILC
jgi:hypothetical protein